MISDPNPVELTMFMRIVRLAVQLVPIAAMALGLSACLSETASKANDQKSLDDRYYALWQEAMAHQSDAQAGKTGMALATFIREIKDTYTDKFVKDWVCKPWSLQEKEVKLVSGAVTASFECLNLDGMRGSVFNIAIPAGALVEPLYNGYVVRFSGKIDKFIFPNDAMKSFYVYVTASSFEVIDRTRN